MIAKYILAPLLGGIIGYITNDIAIKMLFRPRKAIYIGTLHIPFTPGLIPQQKKRIAKSVAHVVSNQLLNSDTLRGAVLSEKALIALRARLHTGLTNLSNDSRTVRDLLLLRFSQDEMKQADEKFRNEAVAFIMSKLIEAHIGSIVADSVFEDIQNMVPDKELPQKISDMIAKRAGGIIEKIIEEKIQKKGPDVVNAELVKLEGHLLDMRLCDLYCSQEKRLPQIEDGIITIYQETLNVNLDKLLTAVNISAIIEKRIAAFDAAQLEHMIFGILKKELKAIVYLGAALGFLMGFINLLL